MSNLTKQQLYYYENRDKILEQRAKYYEENKEIINERSNKYFKSYYEANTEKIVCKNVNYMKELRKIMTEEERRSYLDRHKEYKKKSDEFSKLTGRADIPSEKPFLSFLRKKNIKEEEEQKPSKIDEKLMVVIEKLNDGEDGDWFNWTDCDLVEGLEKIKVVEIEKVETTPNLQGKKYPRFRVWIDIYYYSIFGSRDYESLRHVINYRVFQKYKMDLIINSHVEWNTNTNRNW
jgi:hypothetical protein